LDEQNQESSATGLPPPENVIRLSLEELDQQISEAYRRGVEEGRQVAERGLAHVFRSLREGVDSLARLREKVMRDSEVDLLGLACLIARKIILQEIRQDPRILANIVTAAVSCCSEEEKIIIRLSPGDYQSVTQNRQLFLSGRDDESRIKIVPDDQVKHGGCMVESPTGTVDARIEAQLDEVYNRCLEERGIPMEPSISLNEAE
jgi:flagellar assembly protein FliH